MRYIGSKTASLKILERAVKTHAEPGWDSFCDPFAGVCTVSRHFKLLGFRTITGDVLHQSFCFQRALLETNPQPGFARIVDFLPSKTAGEPHLRVLDYLNSLPGRVGYITRNYSMRGREKRKFFASRNARRIDAVREQIERWSAAELISDRETKHTLLSAY